MGFVLGFVIIKKDKQIVQVPIPTINFDYNKENTDSINRDIKLIDSILNSFNYNYEAIRNLDDSSSIKLFYELIKSK